MTALLSNGEAKFMGLSILSVNVQRCDQAFMYSFKYISRICENNVITQKFAFLSYYPHKITLFFFLYKRLNPHNYTLKNGH